MHEGSAVEPVPAGECVLRGKKCAAVCLRCEVRAEESADRCQWDRRGRKTGWLQPNIDKENSSRSLSCFLTFSPLKLSHCSCCYHLCRFFLFNSDEMCNKHLFIAYLPCVPHLLNRAYEHTSESHRRASACLFYFYTVCTHMCTHVSAHPSWQTLANSTTSLYLSVQLLTLPRLQFTKHAVVTQTCSAAVRWVKNMSRQAAALACHAYQLNSKDNIYPLNSYPLNNNYASLASVTASVWIFTMYTTWEFTRFTLKCYIFFLTSWKIWTCCYVGKASWSCFWSSVKVQTLSDLGKTELALFPPTLPEMSITGNLFTWVKKILVIFVVYVAIAPQVFW